MQEFSTDTFKAALATVSTVGTVQGGKLSVQLTDEAGPDQSLLIDPESEHQQE